MSIWTNSAASGALLALLAGCAGMPIALPSRNVTVLGGAITVAPPAGYCADPKASSDGGDTAVVLMGRCLATSSSAPALITASIGAAGSGAALDAGPVALTQFFTSDAGRGMLAASGKASDAVVTTSQTEDDALLLAIKDSQLGTYWRGILALKGRLVMLSATGVENLALPPDQGRALLSRALSALRRANGAPAQNSGLLAALATAPAPEPTSAPTAAAVAEPASPATPRPKARP
jgi:hypothetical protein